MRRNGRYVVGRPRLTPVLRDDGDPAPDDEHQPHRLECLGPLHWRPHWEAYPTAEDAQAAYRQVVAADPVTPMRNSGVWKVRLVLGGETAEEVLVVRALPRLA